VLEDVAIAISTGAAGNIVASMLNDQMDALRVQIAKMFRHGTGQERATALRILEHDADALSKHNVTRTDLTNQWGNLLLSYLTVHPEARGDIESFAASPVTGKIVNIDSQNFYGPGSFGGDNNGTINNRVHG
jgi:hypothetical protein